MKTENSGSSNTFLLEERLNNDFTNYCHAGNFEIVKNLYNKHSVNNTKKKLFYVFRKIAGASPLKLDLNYCDNSPLLQSCSQNHYDIVEFFLKDKDFIDGLIKSNEKDKVLSKAFNYALKNSNIEMMKLISPLIDKKDIHFHIAISEGYSTACSNGNLDVLNFFFADESINPPRLNNLQPENMPDTFMVNGMVTENRDKLTVIAVSGIKNNGFLAGCIYGSLDTIKYFAESPDSNHYVDVNLLTKNKDTTIIVGSFEVMEYLVFNLNLDKNLYTNGTIELAKIFDNSDHETVLNLFDKRDLFKEINNELSNSSNQTENSQKKKLKI